MGYKSRLYVSYWNKSAIISYSSEKMYRFYEFVKSFMGKCKTKYDILYRISVLNVKTFIIYTLSNSTMEMIQWFCARTVCAFLTHIYVSSFYFKVFLYLTLTMPNFLNGITHLPFLALSIISFRDIKMKTWSWSANSIELRLALYWWQRLITFCVGRITVKCDVVDTCNSLILPVFIVSLVFKFHEKLFLKSVYYF